MPEFAEVEYYRKRWNPGLGRPVRAVLVHERAKVFRGTDVGALQAALTGATLLSSQAAAKQMLFRFRDNERVSLGVHLGMTGELRAEPAGYEPQKHDHLVLVTDTHALVFADPRMFGQIQFALGETPPVWWTRLAPPILSDAFTVDAVAAFLRRRARSPIKAVLLMQERFPGIGNWMADEVLWRAAIHPKKPAGRLTPAEIRALHRELRWVCRRALATIGETYADPPKSWLFPHRWESGGRCPKTKKLLARAEIGGRTTCWSPARQKLR
ncbi:MAG TPA: DNA-formamidopyrimidine glycosylase family protein [Opitutaceae bacterium]|jgi:formamidopyrimidine-DNA glycosylase|nr:DNA-formamidopyrimidine glycosylase family protein [Opitutaceae bacterium]